MKQNDVARIISRRTDITQRTVNEVLTTLASVMADLFHAGEEVRLRVGTFEPHLRPPKPAWDFKNNQKITLPPTTVVQYRPSARIQRVLRQKDREDRGLETQMDVTILGDE